MHDPISIFPWDAYAKLSVYIYIRMDSLMCIYMLYFQSFLAWKQQNHWTIEENQWKSKENQWKNRETKGILEKSNETVMDSKEKGKKSMEKCRKPMKKYIYIKKTKEKHKKSI